MSLFHGNRRMFGRFAIMSVVLMAMIVQANLALAQESVEPTDTADLTESTFGKISVELGFDIVDKYYFRGWIQENQGFIIQPYAELGVDLGNNFGLTLGMWNSFHSESTDATSSPSDWYETDWYVGLGYTWNEFTFDATYTAFTSPSDAWDTIQEIAVSVSYDDSKLWGDSGIALNPHTLFAFEIDRTSALSNSGEEGVYWEVGIEPSFALIQSDSFPVTLSVPMTFGFGLDEYYDNGSDSEFFGFFDVGIDLSMPLKFIPDSLGEWEMTTGIHFLFLGDGPQAANANTDSFETIFQIGVSMSF